MDQDQGPWWRREQARGTRAPSPPSPGQERVQPSSLEWLNDLTHPCALTASSGVHATLLGQGFPGIKCPLLWAVTLASLTKSLSSPDMGRSPLHCASQQGPPDDGGVDLSVPFRKEEGSLLANVCEALAMCHMNSL